MHRPSHVASEPSLSLRVCSTEEMTAAHEGEDHTNLACSIVSEEDAVYSKVENPSDSSITKLSVTVSRRIATCVQLFRFK
jgi:hypothetical protein